MAAIELALAPEAAERLPRLPGMAGAGRAKPFSVSWHDTPNARLAADGLALAAQDGGWTLHRIRPPAALLPPPILRHEDRRELLGAGIPGATVPVATLSGTRRPLRWRGPEGEASLLLLLARLDGHDGHPGLCRLTADGPAPVLAALATTLAAAVPVSPPAASLAAEAIAAATGNPLAPRALGAPAIESGGTVGDALALVLGHLSDVMTHWAARIPRATTPEPVHQMRVATRRLRSALSVFKHAAPCPALAALAAPAKACAARLGAVRDWDVFLEGTGATLAGAFPGDARCVALLRAARRARAATDAGLRGYLAGPEFRSFTVALAVAAALRPWNDPGDNPVSDPGHDPEHGTLRDGVATFGATALARRFKHVRHAGRAIEALDTTALHELRKDCKRLRYTAEFFAPLFPHRPARRFNRRLSALQEELGLLNDGAAVAGLLRQLGRAERGYAAGLVQGLAAGQAGVARHRIHDAWRRFRHAEPFWTA